MAVRIEPNSEPIPGYRLIERLGGGGFGEVWKCEAPGGLHKAIKFVFGNLELAGDSGHRAEQELKALSRVKTVRHPYVLSLERFDIIEGQLLIVMELADRNMWDRFKECRVQGLIGIPREELLRYMAETAEALDLMNVEYQLQHLDIKPQNLFLVHNHIKVADFGLVKDLEGSQASVTGGITPVYAAPETFDGIVSRHSDQYSLAIVFQELLTGHRPFHGTNVRQLILQHLQSAPNLESLDPADRPAIARALSKSPNERFPSCKELVRHLQAAQGLPETGEAPAGSESPDRHDAPTETPPPERHSKKPRPLGEGEQTWAGGRPAELLLHPAQTPPLVDDSTPGPGAVTPSGPGAVTPSGPAAPARQPTRDSGARPRLRPTPAEPARTEVAAPPITPSSPEPEGDGVLFPALVIGLGGTGAMILQSLRWALGEKFGSPEAAAHVRLLLIDTDPEVLRSRNPNFHDEPSERRLEAPFPLTAADLLVTPLNRASYYLKPTAGRLPVDSWLPMRMVYRIPRDPLTAGVRSLGRLAYSDHARAIQRRLQSELEAIAAPETLTTVARRTKLGIRGQRPRVYVAANLAGGTGGGMFIDLAYTVRHLVRQMGYGDPQVTALLFAPQIVARGSRQGSSTGLTTSSSKATLLATRASAQGVVPGPPLPPGKVVPVGNTCAALTELLHFADPKTVFRARYHEHLAALADADAPFGRTFLLAVPDETEARAVRETTGMAARFLLADMCTDLGRVADRGRDALFAVPRNRRGAFFQAFGSYRLAFPRRQVLRAAAGQCLSKVVRHWISKDARALEEPVREWVQEQWRGQELAAEHFIGRIQEACQKRLSKSPEAAFALALEFLVKKVADSAERPRTKSASPSPTLRPDDVAEALGRLQALVGRPEGAPEVTAAGSEPDPNATSAPADGTLLGALRESAEAMANEWSQKLAELAVRLIEQPTFRLAGAEEAVRQIVASIQKVLEHHEPLGRDLADRASQAHLRIVSLLAGDPKARAKITSSDVIELLRSYAKWRLQGLILQQVCALYISLRGHLTDQLRDINFCRVRVQELLGQLEEEAPLESTPRNPAAEGRGRFVFSQGCKDTSDAVDRVLRDFDRDAMLDLDAALQKMIRREFVALVQVCLSSKNVTKNVARAMKHVAEEWVEQRLEPGDVAELIQAQAADETVLSDELVNLFEEAVPELVRNPQAKSPYSRAGLTVLATPPGKAGEELTTAARSALEGVEVLPARTDGEVMLHREWVNMLLTDVEQMGPLAREAYRQMSATEDFTPHTRIDIEFELPE